MVTWLQRVRNVVEIDIVTDCLPTTYLLTYLPTNLLTYLFAQSRAPEIVRYTHRYVLSLEGNDVATALKWALAHNSV